MKYKILLLTTLVLNSLTLHAGTLTELSKKYVASASANDKAQLEAICMDSPTKAKSIEECAQLPEMIKSGKAKVTAVDKELIIGDLGVTLMRIDFDEQPKPSFRPIVCVRIDDHWKVFPWVTTSDMKELAKQRTPEETIHIQLLNEWTHLMGQLLLKQETEQAVPSDGHKPSNSAPLSNTAAPADAH